MNELKIGFVQYSIIWENTDKNLNQLSEQLSQFESSPVDLIVLPEMFTTGFTMNVENMAEPPFGKTVLWMKEYAKKLNSTLAGSIITCANQKYYNRLFIVDPMEKIFFYDKHHLFRIANEHQYYSSGNQNIIVNINGWNVKFLICYDLRFPLWSRNRYENGKFEYDILVYVANWPEQRSLAWKTLLPARAIENQAYVLGVNRVGVDGNQHHYSGDSMLLNYMGECVSYAKPHHEMVIQTMIEKKPMDDFRTKFAFGLDWDHFEIK